MGANPNNLPQKKCKKSAVQLEWVTKRVPKVGVVHTFFGVFWGDINQNNLFRAFPQVIEEITGRTVEHCFEIVTT